MASMIEEADDVSQPLLDVILECVTSPKMEEQPQAYRSQPTCSARCINMCFALCVCAMMDCIQVTTPLLCMLHQDVFCTKYRKEKTTAFGVKLTRSQVSYLSAQAAVFCSLRAMMGQRLSPRPAPLTHFAVLFPAMLCCVMSYPAMLC